MSEPRASAPSGKPRFLPLPIRVPLLGDGCNGRALLKHPGNDIRITVSADYPDFFLFELTNEVKWLAENPDEGWAGLRCNILVRCVASRSPSSRH